MVPSAVAIRFGDTVAIILHEVEVTCQYIQHLIVVLCSQVPDRVIPAARIFWVKICSVNVYAAIGSCKFQPCQSPFLHHDPS
eukprot:1887579-Karenia_brevis.AAC.1